MNYDELMDFGGIPGFFLTGLNWTARSDLSSPISPVRSVYRERSHLLPYGLSCGTPWAWEPSDPGKKPLVMTFTQLAMENHDSK